MGSLTKAAALRVAEKERAERQGAPVITTPPEAYNDNDLATTFGPLEKYEAANDNVPQQARGLYTMLTPQQRQAALAYRGPENHGEDWARRPATDVAAGYEVDTAGNVRPSLPDGGMYVGLRRDQYCHGVPFINADEEIPVLPTRNGDFMQTATGRKFWPMDPCPDEVFIEDIAHSLSLQCRYAGHCLRFYSVAEHSILIARHLAAKHAPQVALWGLLHDASEAYLVDVPRPVKPYLTGYKVAEAAVMEVVCQRFGLPPFDMPPEVHEADERIIADELVNLVPMDWHGRYAGKELGVRLRYWTPGQAREEFMATFDALTGRVAA